MPYRQPLQPLQVAPLIPQVRQELLRVLESLDDAAWQASTACTGWTVRDVAAHLLAADVGVLSNLRDGDGQFLPVTGWAELVTLIDAQNDLWVRALRRASRRLLVDLLRFTGEQVTDLFNSLDPAAPGPSVGWTGQDADPLWLHMARELTEYWTHHQHICEAVGVESLKTPPMLQAVIGTFIYALPQTYRDVAAPPQTLVRVVVNGAGEWHLLRENDCWTLYAMTDVPPTATVRLDADTAWRLFTRNKPLDALRPALHISGDATLGAALLDAVAIIA